MKREVSIRRDAEPFPRLFDRAAPVRRAAVRQHGFDLALLSVALIGCSCAIYLSLRSTGDLSALPWIPAPIGKWADDHGRFRNVPAYFLLACPFLLRLRSPRSRVWVAVGLGLFGTALELAEYFIPGRMVEWQDIAWTWVGVGSAFCSLEGLRRVIARS